MLSIMSMPLQAKQLIRSTTGLFFVGWEMQHNKSSCSYGQLVIGNFITTVHPLMHHILCRVFWQNIKPPKWLSPPQLAPCNFWFFPKLKSPLKGKRFHTVDEIQENTTRHLMAIRKTMWGPKVPTLKRLRHHCPVCNISCILCILQWVSPFFLLHGWILSEQTSYILSAYTQNLMHSKHLCILCNE